MDPRCSAGAPLGNFSTPSTPSTRPIQLPALPPNYFQYPEATYTMAAGTVSNLQAEGLARSESKSARKKKAKAEAAASGTANVTSASTPEATGDKSAESDAKANGASSSEHPYLRELQK